MKIHRKTRQRRLPWFISGAIAAIGTTALTVPQLLFGPQAVAAPTCSKGHYDYSATLWGEDRYTVADAKGTYSEVHVPINDNTPCSRISSLFVHFPLGGGAEFGWIEGVSNCNGTYYPEPVAFMYVIYSGGGSQCTVYGSVKPTQGTYVPFKNLTYGLTVRNYIGANQIGTEIPVSSGVGFSAVGAERGRYEDLCYARFAEIKEYRAADSWTYWDAPFVSGDGDDSSDCEDEIQDSHTVRVYKP